MFLGDEGFIKFHLGNDGFGCDDRRFGAVGSERQIRGNFHEVAYIHYK